MKRQTRILVTGGGGAAAIAFIRSVAGVDPALFVADMDPHAAGLYLTSRERRFLLPSGNSRAFIPALHRICRENRIEVLVPTVDCELLPIACARGRFEQDGTRVLLASADGLRSALDKLKTLELCEGIVPVPRFAAFDDGFSDDGWPYPLIVKPRWGSGSRGITKVETPQQLQSLPRGSDLLVSEYLPGDEYSVDVLATKRGEVICAVPRARLKVDSGISVTGRTFRDQNLESMAAGVVERLGISHVANVQFRRRLNGQPALLEVNPRFPGTISLTVASGVNMPLLCLLDVLGLPSVPFQNPFRETAMVRFWHEEYLNPTEFVRMERLGSEVT